ncbi:DUF11 domain-containing protein, partial [Chloroflexi bacterium TSY]|nr:DUF11 domain-containing protein [Chloroflexi bacterium TSY]
MTPKSLQSRLKIAKNAKFGSTEPDEITIKNFGTMEADISGYRLCSLFDYSVLPAETILAPGTSIVVSSFVVEDTAADLGLYKDIGAFTDPSILIDFTQWGSDGNGRESVAAAKGIWTAGNFIRGPAPFDFIGDGSQYGRIFWTAAFEPKLQKEVDQIVADVGEMLTYSVTVDYVGRDLFSNVTVTDTIPDGATYVSNSVNAGGIENDGVVTWNLGSNKPGVSVSTSSSVGFPVNVGTDFITRPTLVTSGGLVTVTQSLTAST